MEKFVERYIIKNILSIEEVSFLALQFPFLFLQVQVTSKGEFYIGKNIDDDQGKESQMKLEKIISDNGFPIGYSRKTVD